MEGSDFTERKLFWRKENAFKKHQLKKMFKRDSKDFKERKNMSFTKEGKNVHKKTTEYSINIYHFP